ncbi:hypothetical protein FRC03_006180 [Tulasnella sp. 419]|nr:hypothetical protein FRC03_006180 [Tulasnella sp. 419]
MRSVIDHLTEIHSRVSNELTESLTTVTTRANSAHQFDSIPPKYRHEDQLLREEHHDNQHPTPEGLTTLAQNNNLILPAELWTMISYTVADDAYATDLRNIYRQKSRFNLIKVCRRWYHIIQKTKSFRAFLDSSLSLKPTNV